MTVVIAYSNGKNVWLAGDSFCGTTSQKGRCAEPKVYTAGALGVGICGSPRHEKILEDIIRSSNPNDFTEHWVKFVLPDLFVDALKQKNALQEKDGQASIEGSSYLFVLNGNIYHLEEDFSVWQTKDNVAAIGLGLEYAMGALTVLKNKKEKPEEILLETLKACEELCPGVVGPFTIIKVK